MAFCAKYNGCNLKKTAGKSLAKEREPGKGQLAAYIGASVRLDIRPRFVLDIVGRRLLYFKRELKREDSLPITAATSAFHR